jgi:thiamine kinase-like enzyme
LKKNIKQPAHFGLFPEKMEWKQVSNNESSILQKYIDNKLLGIIYKRCDYQSPNQLNGFYKVKGDTDLFVKILGDNTHEYQLRTEKIALWLRDSGINVICTYPDYPKKVIEFDLWIYIYDYIEYDFFLGDVESLYFIGRELGAMHKLMLTSPFAKTISSSGRKKNQLLLNQLTKIKEGSYTPSFSTSAIQLIKKTRFEEYQLLEEYSQMIHGDLNLGNIIFTKGSKKPIFLDFEETNDSWLSPMYDVAFIIQRFIILGYRYNKVEMAIHFINGYLSKNKIRGANDQGFLNIMLRMISIRSLLILSTLTSDEQRRNKDEVSKFVDLHSKMELNEKDIYKIESEILCTTT